MTRLKLACILAMVLLVAVWLGVRLAAPETAVVPGADPRATADKAKPSHVREPAPLGGATEVAMVERSTEPKAGERQGGEMLEEWLSSSTDSDRVGLTIMQNFFQLPEKDHATAMVQLVNLVRDFNIGGLERILLDARTSARAKEILYEDIKLRPDAVKFPIFLNLMQRPDHPHSQDAREIMVNLLGKDFGTDYTAWEKEIDRVIAEG